MKKMFTKFAAVALVAGLFTAPALAAPIKLEMQWSGESFGNNVSAVGTMVVEKSALVGEGFVGMENISDLHFDLSNGQTFGKSAFYNFLIGRMDGLDFSTQLIGQTLANGCTFGTSQGDCGDGRGGDFNFFSSNAPTGTWYFQMTTQSGQTIQLVSLKQANVPEPGSLALLALAAAGLAAARRTGRSKQ